MDELRPQERLKVPDMTVTLKPGTKPFFRTSARPVPIHWKENTENEKKKLLREGTIERCNGNQIRWCSPAHWVPKDDEGTRFRLVTDLRKLNDAVELQVSTFPTADEVMQTIRPDLKIYLTADLTTGYHQVTIRS